MDVGGVISQSLYYLFSQEEKLKRGASEDHVVALVDTLLHEAITLQASDIHLQPSASTLVVRFRIDGVLYDHLILESAIAPLVLSRLKILANLDIAERRIPQDGRLRVCLYDSGGMQPTERVIDFRLSTFPTLYGEKMVIRILDRLLRLLALDSLGLRSVMYDQLTASLRRPHGLFLVTGPTGSGKTTMLYALISALDIKTKNIVTIEDPIEYELAGITQSQVNTKAGFTFENGLRAMLRQDPDIIMVGEIRDKATARIAIESALTGHLVLSTLHTNDAPSAIARLLEMGIEPFLLSATLVGVLAQRLARRLCNECKKKTTATAEQQSFTTSNYGAIETMYKSHGCRQCHNIGYRGRLGIFELLVLNDTLRELVMQKADATTLRSEAVRCGMQPLLFDGLSKVRDAVTSLEEVYSLAIDET